MCRRRPDWHQLRVPSLGLPIRWNMSVVAEVHCCLSVLPICGGMGWLSRLWTVLFKFPALRNYALTRVSTTCMIWTWEPPGYESSTLPLLPACHHYLNIVSLENLSDEIMDVCFCSFKYEWHGCATTSGSIRSTTDGLFKRVHSASMLSIFTI